MFIGEVGDEISIVLPNLTSDSGPETVIARAYFIIKFLSFEVELSQIAKKNGILIPFNFKYATSQASIQKINQEVQSSIALLSTVTDSEIDSAFRVLTKIALPGECLLLPKVAHEIGKTVALIQVSSDRLKGVSNTINLFCLSRNSQIEKESA